MSTDTPPSKRPDRDLAAELDAASCGAWVTRDGRVIRSPEELADVLDQDQCDKPDEE